MKQFQNSADSMAPSRLQPMNNSQNLINQSDIWKLKVLETVGIHCESCLGV